MGTSGDHPDMPDVPVQTSTDSALFEYGKRPFLSKAWINTVVISAAVLLMGALCWIALRTTFIIPNNTALLLSVPPQRVSSNLTLQQRQLLPETWQAAIQTPSRWPVVLGAYRDETSWHYFAFMPRWLKHPAILTQKTSALFVLLSAEPLPASGRTLRYTDNLSWWLAHPFAELTLWADPQQALIDNTSADNGSWSIPAFTATYAHHQLVTDIPFDVPTAPPTLSQADISLALPSATQDTAMRHAILSQIEVGDTHLADLEPTPSKIDLWLDAQLRTQELRLTYQDPIPVNLAKTLLDGFGITESHPTKLPDGTVITERTSLEATSTQRLIGKRTTSLNQPLDLEEKTFIFGAQQNDQQSIHSLCTNFQPWLSCHEFHYLAECAPMRMAQPPHQLKARA